MSRCSTRKLLSLFSFLLNRKSTPGLALVLALAWMPSLPAHAQEPPPRLAEHVIVVCIDGFRPHFYTVSRRASLCRTMRSMKDSGAWTLGATPPYPSLTYPGHATLSTGVWPARHGIHGNNIVRLPHGEGRGAWYAADLKAPALWNRAKAAGLTVAALSWPTTAGAEEIDWNLPEFWSSGYGPEFRHLERWTTPDVLARVKKIGGRDWARIMANKRKRDVLLAELAVDLIKSKKPNLMLLHLVEMDELQHKNGPVSPRVNDGIARVDKMIRDLQLAVEGAGIADRTTFVLVGDHGFAEVRYSIAPNVLLQEHGFITVQDGKVTDWKAFAINSGGSASIYLKDPEDKRLRRAVRTLFQRNAEDETGQVFYRIVEGQTLAAFRTIPEAAFFLEGASMHMFSGSLNGSFIRRSPLRGNHGFLPTRECMKSGFIACGAGIQGGRLEEMDLTDVAPTVAALLGFEFPDTDGRALEEILRLPAQ